MRKQTGFTLVELVVVVMILGILAAVAAPKLLGTSSTATDNGIKQTLAVVRDAIERYRGRARRHVSRQADTEADFKTDLKPYLRGTFPTCPVGNIATVAFSTANPLAVTGTTGGWHFLERQRRVHLSIRPP